MGGFNCEESTISNTPAEHHGLYGLYKTNPKNRMLS